MWGDTVKKLFISQPMRGREYDAIMAERKALIADAVIFAPGWRDARGCRVEHVVASEYDLKIIHGKEVVV